MVIIAIACRSFFPRLRADVLWICRYACVCVCEWKSWCTYRPHKPMYRTLQKTDDSISQRKKMRYVYVLVTFHSIPISFICSLLSCCCCCCGRCCCCSFLFLTCSFTFPLRVHCLFCSTDTATAAVPVAIVDKSNHRLNVHVECARYDPMWKLFKMNYRKKTSHSLLYLHWFT